MITDTERLDFLESLLARSEFQNSRRPKVSVGSDLWMNDGQASLYLRNMFGRTVQTGDGDSVRAAIDQLIKEEYLIEVRKLLSEFYTDDEINVWLDSSNKLLGGKIANDLIKEGRTEEVIQVIKAMASSTYL